MSRDLQLPRWLDADAADFVAALLQVDPSARLGAAGAAAARAAGAGAQPAVRAYDAIREHAFMRASPAAPSPSSLRHVCLHAAAGVIIAAGCGGASPAALHAAFRRRIAALPPRAREQLAHVVRLRGGHRLPAVRGLWWEWPAQARFARAATDRVYLGDDRCGAGPEAAGGRS